MPNLDEHETQALYGRSPSDMVMLTIDCAFGGVYFPINWMLQPK
jgi:hypothetical protein